MSIGKTPIADRADGAGKTRKLIIRGTGGTQVEIDATEVITGPDPEIARVKTATALSSATLKSITDPHTVPPIIHSELNVGDTIVLSSDATDGRVVAINALKVRVNGVEKTIYVPFSMPY